MTGRMRYVIVLRHIGETWRHMWKQQDFYCVTERPEFKNEHRIFINNRGFWTEKQYIVIKIFNPNFVDRVTDFRLNTQIYKAEQGLRFFQTSPNFLNIKNLVMCKYFQTRDFLSPWSLLLSKKHSLCIIVKTRLIYFMYFETFMPARAPITKSRLQKTILKHVFLNVIIKKRRILGHYSSLQNETYIPNIVVCDLGFLFAAR
jgi:hypothetical protein